MLAAVVATLLVAALLALLLLPAGEDSGFDYDDPFDHFPRGETAGAARKVSDAPDADRRLVAFLRFVTNDVQGFWEQEFRRGGADYQPAQLLVFEDVVQTGCGLGSEATGPFYCALDRSVYLDLDFFRALAVEFKSPGDFAQAYVIAHEIGHHVQNLTGVTAQVQQAQIDGRAPPSVLSIGVELQADCLAGVWGHSTYERGLLDRGDLDEGLRAAAAVGDDRIQKRTTGRIDPETWTHGSSQQRRTWLLRGFEKGDPDACDTFSPQRSDVTT
jgi:uncharacterized protein